MVIFSVLLVLVGGFCSAFQSPTNATLSTYVGNFQSACISFGGGVLVLFIAVLTIGNGDLTQIGQAEPWELVGGVYGAYMVLMITYTAPVLGIALTLTVNMFGQIVTGMVIDYFGFFGTEPSPLDPVRLAGCVAVGLGIYLVYIGKTRQKQKNDSSLGKSLFIGALMFIGGVGGSIQSPTNAALAVHIGKIEASFISFLGGFLILFIFTLIMNRGKFQPVRGIGIRPWMILGGLYGAAIVFFNVVATPYLGVALLVATAMFGQLAGALIIDNFGLLRAVKVDMNKWRIIGVAVIAAGVVLVTIARL